MRFSTDYLYCFHYSDGMGYLIFCCHSVAMIKLVKIEGIASDLHNRISES